LETREQILSSGVEDFLSPDGVAVIEWAERIVNEETKQKIIFVSIEIVGESERKIIYDDFL
jgi:tRNA A37 threonylcarbamoyladenosine biosynthesis protein TsaE